MVMVSVVSQVVISTRDDGEMGRWMVVGATSMPTEILMVVNGSKVDWMDMDVIVMRMVMCIRVSGREM